MKKYIFAIIIGVIGGGLFQLTRMPLPWTLGPMATVGIAQLYFKKEIFWPSDIRNMGLVVLGYVMGRSFTPETGERILSYLPWLIVVTLLTTILCLLGGLITKRYTNISLSTSLFGSLPAGLSQTAAICEEIEGSDSTVVALMQTVRVILVVFIVPFISLHGFSNSVNRLPNSIKYGINDVLTLAGCIVFISFLVYLGKFIKVPGRYILMPILGTAAITIGGINTPSLPAWVISAAQLCIGIKMGMSVNLTSLANWRKISFYSMLNFFGLLSMLMAADYLISKFTTIPYLTIFIGTAPGGMAEMGLTAMMVKADLPTVIAFQIFRLLFVFLVVIPFLSWWFKRKNHIQS
ncbi:MAG: AbrB family transcriptional regulator [Peptococcaceae bacterium]|nr:AbrB family transcriptional regulator [Peptococcaceae bacterium]